MIPAQRQREQAMSAAEPEFRELLIDRLLGEAGWTVCDTQDADLHAARGVAIREFPLKCGHGFARYRL